MDKDRITELQKVSARLRSVRRRRDQLVKLASAEGLSLRSIGRAADLTHTAVAKILARSQDSTLGR